MTALPPSVRRLWLLLAMGLLTSLAACGQADKATVAYYAVNETDKDIVSIIINGEGGVLDAKANADGGEMCCVVMPRKWRPGLTATIKWELDGEWLKDGNGHEVVRDGKRVYVRLPYLEKTVEVPEYDERVGRLYIHFLPNNQIKVLVSVVGPAHPDYPFPTADKASSP